MLGGIDNQRIALQQGGIDVGIAYIVAGRRTRHLQEIDSKSVESNRGRLRRTSGSKDNTLFERENRSESYGLFELPELTPATLYTLLLMNPCLRGFNVTAPYKEAIVPMLDSMDSVARDYIPYRSRYWPA